MTARTGGRSDYGIRSKTEEKRQQLCGHDCQAAGEGKDRCREVYVAGEGELTLITPVSTMT